MTERQVRQVESLTRPLRKSRGAQPGARWLVGTPWGQELWPVSAWTPANLEQYRGPKRAGAREATSKVHTLRSPGEWLGLESAAHKPEPNRHVQ